MGEQSSSNKHPNNTFERILTMKSNLSLIISCGFLAIAAGRTFNVKDNIEIRDCGSKVTIETLRFDGCSEFPCIVTSGTHATGQLTMTANSATSSLTCEIIGEIAGLQLPFNGCPVNACLNMVTGDCPVEEGEQLVYDMDIEILAIYPKIEILARWMLKDDSGDNFLCFEIPMKIQ